MISWTKLAAVTVAGVDIRQCLLLPCTPMFEDMDTPVYKDGCFREHCMIQCCQQCNRKQGQCRLHCTRTVHPITPFSPIVNMPEDDQATDVGNMPKKFRNDCACGSGDILAHRQTHRQAYSSQYFAAAPTGEVIMSSQHTTSHTN